MCENNVLFLDLLESASKMSKSDGLKLVTALYSFKGKNNDEVSRSLMWTPFLRLHLAHISSSVPFSFFFHSTWTLESVPSGADHICLIVSRGALGCAIVYMLEGGQTILNCPLCGVKCYLLESGMTKLYGGVCF